MAISGDILTQGNLVANAAYLRISDVAMLKINEGINKGKWKLQYGVECYVSAEERAKDDAQPLAPKQVGRYWLMTDDEPNDPYAVAYADLKTQPGITNAADLL